MEVRGRGKEWHGGDDVSTARDPRSGEEAAGEKCCNTSVRPDSFLLSDLDTLYCLKCFVIVK